MDDLQSLVNNYNATPHRGLDYTAPMDVTKKHEVDLWAYMYMKKTPTGRRKRRTSLFKFKVGDLVRKFIP